MSILFKVVSLYPYSGNDDSDLCFEGKQIINVTRIENDEWYLGNYLDKETDTVKEGIFPQNYVKKVDLEHESAPIIPRKPSKENKVFNAVEKESETFTKLHPEAEKEGNAREDHDDESGNKFAPELSLRERIAFMLQQQQQDTTISPSNAPPKREKVAISVKERLYEGRDKKENVEDVIEEENIEQYAEVVADDDEVVAHDDEVVAHDDEVVAHDDEVAAKVDEEEADVSAAHKQRLVERMAKLSGAGRIGGGFNPFGVAVPKSTTKFEESSYSQNREDTKETEVTSKAQMQFNIMTGEVMDMQQFNSKILKKTKTNEELKYESSAEVLEVFAGEDSESSEKKITPGKLTGAEEESAQPVEGNLEEETEENTTPDKGNPNKHKKHLEIKKLVVPSAQSHAYTNSEKDSLSTPSSPDYPTLADPSVAGLVKTTSLQSAVENGSASSEDDSHPHSKTVPSMSNTSQKSFDAKDASNPSSPSVPNTFSAMSKSSRPPIPTSNPTTIKASPPPIPTTESISPNKRKSINSIELPKHDSKPTADIPHKRASKVSKTIDTKPPPIPEILPVPYAKDSIGIKKTKAPEIPPPMPKSKPNLLQRFETFDEKNDVNSDVKIDFKNFFFWVNTGTIPESSFITNENPVGKYVVERDITENILRDGHSKITIFNYYVLFEDYSYIVATVIAKNGNESILATDQDFCQSKIDNEAVPNMPNANGLVIDAVFKSIGTETNFNNSKEWVQSIFRSQKIAPIIANRTFGANIFKYQPGDKNINIKTPIRAGDILVIKSGNFSQEALEILVITDFDSTELLFKCVSVSNIGTIAQETRNIQEMTKGKLRVFRPIPRAFINW